MSDTPNQTPPEEQPKDAQPEPAEPELPPFVIEGARSSRSKCKACRRKIDKGALRIGILIEGPYGTGYMWHHIKCAARRHLHRVEEAYELEAWKEAGRNRHVGSMLIGGGQPELLRLLAENVL